MGSRQQLDETMAAYDRDVPMMRCLVGRRILDSGLCSNRITGMARDCAATSVSHAHCPASSAVERVDTHCSAVFLVGRHAYKLKRAISFASLDYTTTERREAACRAELALNRRTAPDLYRAVRSVPHASEVLLRILETDISPELSPSDEKSLRHASVRVSADQGCVPRLLRLA